MSNQYNQVKLDNGLIVNGKEIKHINDVKIDSGIDNLSEVTVTFLAKVDGLDNIVSSDPYKFVDEIDTKDGVVSKVLEKEETIPGG